MAKGKHLEKILNPLKIKNLNEPGFYADGNGLYLKVDANGSKRWIQRVVIQGKRTDMGLGSQSLVSLAEAREKALQNRKLARSGGDPLQLKKREQAIPTFEYVAKQVHQHHQPTWRNAKHGGQWLNTLELYAFPKLGKKLISQISSTDIMSVLLPIWTIKPETAKRVHQRISSVMKWAVAQEWRGDNPAENLRKVLPKIDSSAVKHRLALPYVKVGDAIRVVKSSEAHLATKLVFEFLVLTAARSGEVRLAHWDEVNLEGKEWIVPAERMKAKRAHRVPLSDAAVKVLLDAKERLPPSEGGFIFPGSHGKPITDNTLSKLLRELNVGAVPHGFRSSFRDWAAEQTHYPREVAEAALAHTIKSKVEAAYMRTDHLEKRRQMMIDWGLYVLRDEA